MVAFWGFIWAFDFSTAYILEDVFRYALLVLKRKERFSSNARILNGISCPRKSIWWPWKLLDNVVLYPFGALLLRLLVRYLLIDVQWGSRTFFVSLFCFWFMEDIWPMYTNSIVQMFFFGISSNWLLKFPVKPHFTLYSSDFQNSFYFSYLTS